MRPNWPAAGSWRWSRRTGWSARTLEREWNEKLAEVERLERDAALRPQLSARLVDPEERRRILALAQDLPAVWHAPTTPQTERKQLLGYLIKDVTLCRGETTIHVAIRWQTEACTALEVPRPERVVRGATDRSGGRRSGPSPGPGTHRPPDRRAAGSGGIPVRHRGPLHRGQGPMDPLCSLDPQRLPGGPGRMPGWLSRGRALYGPGGGGAVERDGLDDRRLVPVRPPGWHSGGATRPLVDQADTGDRSPSLRRPIAAPLVPAFRDLTDPGSDGGQARPPGIPNPLAKRCSMNDRSGCPAGSGPGPEPLRGKRREAPFGQLIDDELMREARGRA